MLTQKKLLIYFYIKLVSMITREDIDSAFKLLSFLVPVQTYSVQSWDKDVKIISNRLYQIEKDKEIKMLFFRLNSISEITWRKIYKKSKDLEHLNFTIKKKDGYWFLSWE